MCFSQPPTSSQACVTWSFQNLYSPATPCHLSTRPPTEAATPRPGCAGGTTAVPPPPPPPPPPAPPGAKNVLLVVVDDLRPQLNVSYGQSFVHTPNMDSLSSGPGSIVFTRAYAQLAWCSPSRNSFLTSRYPDTLQIWNFGKDFRHTPANPPLPPNGGAAVVTLPQWFKQHGYISLGGGKVFHPGSPPNNDVPHSWSTDLPYFLPTMDSCPRGTVKRDGGCTTSYRTDGFNGTTCNGCAQTQPDEFFTDWQTANHTVHALRLAKSLSAERPFFIAAGFRTSAHSTLS
eukprot:COSAG06_NODE_1282_length_10016_cov_230.231118_6_plen_287_part_00